MTMESGDEVKRAQVFVWAALFNLFLGVIGIGLMLWIFTVDRGVREEIAQRLAVRQTCEQRVIVAPAPMVVDPTRDAPPQDRPKDGYFGSQGADIREVFSLSFEAIRSGRPPTSPLEQLRLGSQDAVPSKTIHLVNLWATYCEPCRDEMPDFREMFARRADWGGSVRFLPMLAADSADPIKAYADLERLMPPAPVKLADRAHGDPLTTLLRADAERLLFAGELPVTLLLDCNRRVRWAHLAQLNRADFNDLERVIDQLRAELEDTSPGSWCTQAWPGNGRCDEGENVLGKQRVVEDCGEPKLRPQDAAGEAVTPPPTPTVQCPPGSEPTPEGRCKRKLRGNLGEVSQAPAQAASCGNGVCDEDESRETCCDDCACEAPLMCRPAPGGAKRCQVKGLRGGG